jgi:ubiquinone biosynthesis accessory factor UbiK
MAALGGAVAPNWMPRGRQARSFRALQGEAAMMSSSIPAPDELVRKLMAGVPEALGGLRTELEAHFRAVMQSQFARLDLCTREEFGVQVKVLERARSKVDALEARVAALEQQLAAGPR